MPAVQEERPSDAAGVEQLLEPHVLGVVAAHEADLDEPAAQPLLRLHDPQGTRRIRGQRLLAEHRQPPFQRVQDRFLVGGPRRGDEYGVHPGRGYRGRRVGVGAHALQGGRDLLDPVPVGVGHGHHPGSADGPPEAADVVRAHLPGADDGDAERAGHVGFLQKGFGQRVPQERR